MATHCYRWAFFQLGHFALEACDGLLQADGLPTVLRWEVGASGTMGTSPGERADDPPGAVQIKDIQKQLSPGSIVGICWRVEGCQHITRIRAACSSNFSTNGSISVDVNVLSAVALGMPGNFSRSVPASRARSRLIQGLLEQQTAVGCIHHTHQYKPDTKNGQACRNHH